MAKIIRGILENLTDYFLNIIVNVNFFDDLEFEYNWALKIQSLKIQVKSGEILAARTLEKLCKT